MMGVFPEPARCADDVGGLVPARVCGRDRGEAEGFARQTRRVLRHHASAGRSRVRAGIACSVALGLFAGFGLPQTAFAPAGLVPAAQAHDRIDPSPRAARLLAEIPAPEAGATWDNLPLPEQDPPTSVLIADNLAALPRVTQEAGGDAVRFGSRSVPLKVVDTIVRASEEAGVDPVYMMALADKESRFDTDAKAATSSAQGLFQFVAGTWLELIRDYGGRHGLAEEAAAVKGSGPGITVAGGMRERVLALRNDPRIAAAMAAELIKRDRERIEAQVGRPLSSAELYLAHFLGRASAGRFLALSSETPDVTAANEFRTAARANRSLFTQKEGNRRRHLTIAEFHSRIEDMIDARLERYQGVRAVAAVAAAAAEEAPAGTAARRVAVSEALPQDDER